MDAAATNEEFDLAVVGAGLIGAAAARHACADGVRVALIGPSEQPHDTACGERSVFGAHHDEGRIARCTGPDPTWALLAQRSIARYAEISSASGIEFFAEVGHLAVGPRGAPDLDVRHRTAVEAGLACERLDEEALRRQFPRLAFPGGTEGIWEPSRSGHISARRLVQAQVRAAVTHGHCARFDVHAESVHEPEPAVETGTKKCCCGCWLVRLRGGGVVRARKVLLACGAFINGPAALLPRGLALDLCNKTIQTVQRSVSVADAARLAGMPSIIAKFPGDWSAYVLPPIEYPDGRLVLKLGGERVLPPAPPLAATANEADESRAPSPPTTTGDGRLLATVEDLVSWYRSGGDPTAAAEMAAMLESLVPGLEAADTVRADASADCYTPTGLPFIGPVVGGGGRGITIAAGLFVATGGNGQAAKSSDEIGRLGARAALSPSGWDEDEAHPLLREAARFAPRLLGCCGEQVVHPSRS